VKGFIFAAGFGTRLRPLTNTFPKPLMPICNVPSILYSILLMKEAGIRDVICNLHYMADDIKSFFNKNDNFGINIHFSCEDEILGTGGGLKKCEGLLKDDTFLLCNSDAIFDISIHALVDAFGSSQSEGMLVLKDTGNPARPVYVANGIIKDINYTFYRESSSPYTYTGMAILTPRIFRYLEQGFSSIVYTGYTSLVENHELSFYQHDGYWLDVGTVDAYHRVNMDIMDNIQYWRQRFLNMNDNIVPVIEDKDVQKGEGARIIHTVSGKGSNVETGSMVQNSVLLPGSHVPQSANYDGVIVMDDNALKV